MNDAMTGFELFDKLSDKFFMRLLIDIVSMLVLVRLIYFRIYKKKDYLSAVVDARSRPTSRRHGSTGGLQAGVNPRGFATPVTGNPP